MQAGLRRTVFQMDAGSERARHPDYSEKQIGPSINQTPHEIKSEALYRSRPLYCSPSPTCCRAVAFLISTLVGEKSSSSNPRRYRERRSITGAENPGQNSICSFHLARITFERKRETEREGERKKKRTHLGVNLSP